MKKRFSLLFALLCLELSFYISCTIGLGSSVDTQPPSFDIVTPEVDKIIRDKFQISGTWQDDGHIKSVSVSIKKTSGNKELYDIPASFGESGSHGNGYWSATVNPKDADGNVVIKDGTYQATVLITDSMGRETIQRTTFTIDNTPPVIVLTRPSTGISSESSDTYGQTFNLEGQAADTNNVSLIEVLIYADEDCTDSSFRNKVSLKNVPNSINMDVAEFKINDTENDYYKIYRDTTTEGGAKDFYCKIVAYDGAMRYPVDGAARTEDDDKGNATEYYYLYKDIASSILSEYRITDVYSILNGNFSEDTSNRVLQPADLEPLLDSKTISVGKFTLNPKNNPTFVVTGRNPLVRDSESGKFTFSSSQDLSYGGRLVIEVSPGLDGYPLKKESLKPYAQLYSNDAGAEGQRIYLETDIPEERGNSYRYVAIIDKTQDFEIGKNYIVGVEGVDESPAANPVEAEAEGYGFHMAASGKAPELNVISPEKTNTYVPRTDSINIKGTVSVEFGKPDLYIIYKEENKEEVKQPLALTKTGADSEYQYSFDHTIDAAETFEPKSAQIPLKIIAVQDKLETIAEKNIVYDYAPPKVDLLNTSPYISKIVKYNDQGVSDGKQYLNGAVEFKFSIVDDDDTIEKDGAEYLIYDEDGTLIESETLENPTQATFTIDTTEKKTDGTPLYPDGKKITLKIHAKDRAGNEILVDRENDSSVWTYIVDQTTDIPKVFALDDSVNFAAKTFADYKNAQSRLPAGNKLSLKLYDDDGPVDVKIRYTKQPISSEISDAEWNSLINSIGEPAKWNEYEENVSTDSNYDRFSVKDTGFFLYDITVKDINGKEFGTGPFLLKVTKSAVAIDEITPDVLYVNEKMKLENTVSIAFSEGPYSLERTISGPLNTQKRTWTSPVLSDSDFTNGYVDIIDAKDLYPGKNTISYIVIDGEDWHSSSKAISITRDDEGPENLLITVPSADSTETVKNVISSESYKFSGTVSDSNGIAAVYYAFVENGTTPPSPVSYGTNGKDTLSVQNWNAKGLRPAVLDNGWYFYQEFVSGTDDNGAKLSEGLNYKLLVYAVDKAGNVSEAANRTFEVDLQKPVIKNISGVKNIHLNTENASDAETFALSVDAFDSLGIDSVAVSYDELTTANPVNLIKDSADGKYKKTFAAAGSSSAPSNTVKLTDGSYTLVITAKDKVGNTVKEEVSFVVDITPPEVTLEAPVDADESAESEGVQVNGIIRLSGTAGDKTGDVPNNKFTVTQLKYKKIKNPDGSAAADTWHVIDEELMGDNYRIVSSENFTVLNFDTTKLTDRATYELCAVVKDNVGNETESSTVTINVVQDTDRPVITVTSPSSIDMTDDAATWENGTINGTVSDDDGAVAIAYYIGDSIDASTEYTPITISNGIWKVENLQDGTNKVFFKVTAGGKTYYANTTGAYDEGTYKLTDGSHNYGYYSPSDPSISSASILTLIVDTVAPDAETAEYSYDDGAHWNTGIGAQNFGGTKRKKFRIRQTAWDKNLVKSMTVKVIENVNGVDNPDPKIQQFIETSDEVEKFSKIYRCFTSNPINVETWKSSGKDSDGNTYAYRIEISVSDGIKNTITKLDLTIDNTPPVISFSGPAVGSINSGEITVYGTSNEQGTLSYTVSTYGDELHKPSLNKKLTSWNGYVVAEDGSRIEKNGTISGSDGTGISVPAYKEIPNTNYSWYVYFDGNKNDPERAHANHLKYYAEELGITEDLTNFSDLVNFYIWIKAEDSAGNISESPYLVCLDPQGDRPTVSLSNPEKDGDSLGGTVKLFGFAEDSNGTIESVWVQLLSAKNGSGFGTVNKDASNKITNFTLTAKDLEFWNAKGYTVAKMKPDENGVHTPWTSSVTDAQAADYGIKANFSGTSWNLKINGQGEFDPDTTANSQNDMALRVYSCDDSKNLSYSVTRYFTIDKDNPVISDVVLTQYDDDSNLISSQEVRQGMYVKGKWYLEFSVKDNGELEGIYLDDETFPSASISDVTESGASGVHKKIKYALPTDSPGIGSFHHVIKATDYTNHFGTFDVSINWDNEAPKLLMDTSDAFDIDSSVRQNHGFYNLKSQVSDESKMEGTPSGVKAVGFYFMRRKATDEGLIYDTMQKRAAPLSTKNLVYSDGLYWLSGNIECNENGSVTLGAGLAEKISYIHSGTYIKLGGVMYKITSVNETTISIDESHSNSFTSAQIALAQFVDNRKSEYESSTVRDSDTGYYTSIKNDDDDCMIEELGGTNTVSTWQAAIVSRNIPDGPIEIHYTAFDESMNYAVGVVGNKNQETYESYSTDEVAEIKDKTRLTSDKFASYVYTYKSDNPAYISNNAPRLAGVKVAIDYTGADKYENATAVTYYYQTGIILIKDNPEKKPVAITDNLIISDTIKDSSENIIGHRAVTTIKGKTWIIPEMVGGNGKLWYNYKIFASGENGYKDESNVINEGNENASYFADGSEDYDKYERESANQTYVESHEAAKTDADTEPAIVHATSIFTGTDGTGDTLSANQPFWFDYIIYDSTEVEPAGNSVAATELANNQKAKISIAMAVEVNDSTVPAAEINPLYWKSATDNSVYRDGAGRLLGHVELKADLGTSALGTTYGTDDDKVSGTVVFTGYAYDNKCLSKLEWGIKKSDNWIFPEINSKLQDGASFETSTGEWTNSLNMSTAHYSFEVSDNSADGAYHDKNGHKVKWTLTVDTSHIKDVVAKDVQVIILATDSSAKKSEITADSTYQVDIIPYVTGITTSLTSLKKKNPSVFNRTALGHYPVRIGETVTFIGFNLGTNTTFEITDSLNSAAYHFKVGELEAANNLNKNDAKGEYQGTVDLAQEPSGNKNIYDNYYNRQPNGDNNNLLTDDIYFDVWEFHNNAVESISGKIEQPVMKINPVTGQLGFAFVNGPLYFSMGGASDHGETSYDYWMGSFDFFTSVGFTYDSLGHSYGVAAGGDINSNAADKFQLMTSRWGAAGRFQHGSYSGFKYRSDTMPAASSLRLESIGMRGTKAGGSTKNYDKQRIKSPSFATSVHNDVTNLYLAYYDAMSDEIRFKAGDSEHFNIISWGITETDKYYQITRFDNGGNTNENLYAHYDSTNTGKISDNQFVTLYADDKTTPINPGKVYKVAGSGSDSTTNCWFRLEEVSFPENQEPTGFDEIPLSENLGYYPATNALTDVTSAVESYVRVSTVVKPLSSFIDYDLDDMYSYRHETVSMLAGSSTGQNAGEYLSIGVVPGTKAENDVVVACWYDATDRVLRYAYNDSPMTNRNGSTDGSGWTYAVNPVFSGDMENAGEYCQLAVDAQGGIHIAAYDGVNCDLVYAYLSKYDEEPQSCVIDSSGVVGSNITIDVALTESGQNGKPIPRIGYYATSCVRPKIAYLVDTTAQTPTGSDDETFTGKWECSVIPTSSNVTLQSNQYNKMNVAVWKNSSGVIARADDSSVFTAYNKTSADNNKTNTPDVYNSTSYGFVYGNGTSNAIMGYAIKVDAATDAIETAQMK